MFFKLWKVFVTIFLEKRRKCIKASLENFWKQVHSKISRKIVCLKWCLVYIKVCKDMYKHEHVTIFQRKRTYDIINVGDSRASNTFSENSNRKSSLSFFEISLYMYKKQSDQTADCI